MPVTDTVDAYIQTLEATSRRVSETEWGLTVDAAGWPLHLGLAWRDGLLRATHADARRGEDDERERQDEQRAQHDRHRHSEEQQGDRESCGERAHGEKVEPLTGLEPVTC